jgi:tRNA pseudouridine38-40 synthase
MRIALGIEYDGTAYNGWQRQRTGVGVQAFVEKALTVVADEPIEVTCAGRTDTGVHATGQVIHFDTSAPRSDHGWLLGINSNLPDDINATWSEHVGDDFHARFSATARHYRYRILNQLARSAMSRHRAWWVHQALDVEQMRSGAKHLLGEHDFSAFRAAGCQASTARRTIHSLELHRDDNQLTLHISANAFLQHMVRNITGTLVAVGLGEQSPAWIREVLESGDRKRGGIAAPAHGLTLKGVSYPESCSLPACRSVTSDPISFMMRP